MTEKELIDIGFKKQEDIDDNEPYYYYTYNIAQGFSFITNEYKFCINDKWYVEFFDSYPLIRFTDIEDLKEIIRIIKKNIILEK